jgi:hypothetical protein
LELLGGGPASEPGGVGFRRPDQEKRDCNKDTKVFKLQLTTEFPCRAGRKNEPCSPLITAWSATQHVSTFKAGGFYPIPDHGAIYSSNVLVLRKSDADGCAILSPDKRWWTSVISVAAIAGPRLKASGKEYARDEDKQDMVERIRTVLRVAATEQRKNIILGALGCIMRCIQESS